MSTELAYARQALKEATADLNFAADRLATMRLSGKPVSPDELAAVKELAADAQRRAHRALATIFRLSQKETPDDA